MLNYTPYNWYWLAKDGRIYSSALQSLINKTDALYVGWLASGNTPTRWPQDVAGEETIAELAKVLAPYGLVIGTLTDIKAGIKRAIDTDAEAERLRYITAGTGQAMTYQRKVDEAKRLQADTGPATATDYPLLGASIGIDGASIQAVAAVVLGMDAAWAQIGAQIERIRLTAKQAVDDALDEAAARAVVTAIIWPSAQQGATDHE